jgi:sulfur carrier protein
LREIERFPEKMTIMEVTINQERQELQEGLTVAQLIAAYGYESGDGIAVAINEEIVPKHKWDDRVLEPDDEVTVIQATQGG